MGRIEQTYAYARTFTATYRPLMEVVARRDGIAPPSETQVFQIARLWLEAGVPVEQAPAWFIAGYAPARSAELITAGEAPDEVAKLLAVMAAASERPATETHDGPPDMPAAETVPISPERRAEIIDALNGGREQEMPEVIWMGVWQGIPTARLADGSDLHMPVDANGQLSGGPDQRWQ